MNFAPVRTPKLLTRVFSDLVWRIDTTENAIYLTFDDGPTPGITDWTLDILKRYDAKATFFCIGKNIASNPELFQRIPNEGHAIGNHTNTHLKGWKASKSAYLEDTLEAQKIINDNLKEPRSITLFRPPYGQIKPKQIKALSKLGFTIVMWQILSLDWDSNVSKETCALNVIEHASNGDIIVFHDSIKASRNMQYALPKVLDYFSEKGFEFKRIPESSQ